MAGRKSVVWLALGAGLLAASAALWLGQRAERRAAAQFADALEVASGTGDAAPVRPDQLPDLPVPVARYLARVLRPGQPPIRLARLRQSGTLRTDAMKDRWLPFTAEQVVAPGAAGFLWNARVGLMPLLHVRVRDGLFQGRGSGHVSLLSALTIASAQGNEPMNAGALHRFLAESVWYPTALVPSDRLRWSAVDDTSAQATLTAGGVSVSLEFRFNAAGEVSGIYTPGRWGSFDGGDRQVPWEGHFRRYAERGGMLVPSEGEVGWWLGGEWRPVWKGRVLEAEYDFIR